VANRDPAVLFYIDTWLTATAEMDSDVRGWYLNLILHHFDKKDLPNDIEKLALLAGVKFSEFERFKQMFEQVLMQKFTKNDSDRLENSYAKQILQSRKQFKDKRSKSGNIGVVIKVALELGFNKNEINKLKTELHSFDSDKIDTYKNKHLLEQMLKQMRKLYINKDKNEDIIDIKDNKEDIEDIEFNYKKSLLKLVGSEQLVKDFLLVRKNKKLTNTQTGFETLEEQIELSGKPANEIIKLCVERSWGSFKKEWLENIGLPEVKKQLTEEEKKQATIEKFRKIGWSEENIKLVTENNVW